MAISPPDAMTWLARMERFARAADELDSFAERPRAPTTASRAGMRDLLNNIDVESLEGAGAQALFAEAKALIISWLDREDGLHHAITSAFPKASEALRQSARAIIGERNESERRLAWVYQLYVLRSMRPESMLLESGMRGDFGVDYDAIDDWIRWATSNGLVKRANEAPDRGFKLTSNGATFVEDELRAASEHAAPTRVKQQKFKVLDAPELLASDLAALERSPAPLGTVVLFFDLDHFKKLNSELTEREVDRSVLPSVHKAIRDAVAHNGFGYSEGGDEFIALLPNANEAMALAFAEALRIVISKLVFSTPLGARTITASFGLASTDEWSLSELPDRANEAKAEAKEQGRNRVVVRRRARTSEV